MRKILKKIKINLCKFEIFNKIITDRSIELHKKKINNLEKKFKGRLKFYSPVDFKYLLKKRYNSCHIWGSGSSVNITKKFVINRNDFFHIGIGFSCLLNIDYNFFLIENASKKNINLIEAQNEALKKILSKKKTILVFKNLWQKKNDEDIAYEIYKDKAYFIKDLIIPHYNMSDLTLDNTINKLLIYDPHYFREACSSVVTSIIFAKFLGFKEIVLHGIDFSKDYFFDENYYKKNYPKAIPPHVKDVYDKKWRSNYNKHPTANCLEMLIPKLKVKLKHNYNINLFSSSKSSGSSKFLDTYFKD